MIRRRGAGRRTGRPSKYGGVKLYKETAVGKPILMPGGGNNLRAKLTANLLDITDEAPQGATASTLRSYVSLYERYAIVGVKFRFIPTTTSTDSGTRAADRVCYAVNRGIVGEAIDENSLVRQNDCKFTNTTKEFTIYVKNPKPVLLEQISPAGGQQAGFVTPVAGNGVNANLQAPTRKGLTWLSTRMAIAGAPGALVSAQPDHVGADLHITCLNPAAAEPYQVYTMYKTVYYAFKEQD